MSFSWNVLARNDFPILKKKKQEKERNKKDKKGEEV